MVATQWIPVKNEQFTSSTNDVQSGKVCLGVSDYCRGDEQSIIHCKWSEPLMTHSNWNQILAVQCGGNEKC